MQEFYKTPIGQLFFKKQIPELVFELRRLADEIEKANKLTQKQQIKERRVKRDNRPLKEEELISKLPDNKLNNTLDSDLQAVENG